MNYFINILFIAVDKGTRFGRKKIRALVINLFMIAKKFFFIKCFNP
jgi:hypothetical protein